MNTFQQYFSVTSPGHQVNTVHRDHTHTHKHTLRSQQKVVFYFISTVTEQTKDIFFCYR